MFFLLITQQGLYPESHGIVAHEFYDPELGRNFSLPAAGFNFSDPNLLDPLWWTGEPIWYTLKRQVSQWLSLFLISLNHL